MRLLKRRKKYGNFIKFVLAYLIASHESTSELNKIWPAE
jgi:hypothetical protein